MNLHWLLAFVSLLTALHTDAAVLTVGPNGEHSNLQTALNIAIDNGEDDEIRIQEGLIVSLNSQAIHDEPHHLAISGGWDAEFILRRNDPSSTSLSGNQENRVIDFTISDGEISISNITITSGDSALGGGALLLVQNDSRVTLSDCRFIDNQIIGGTFGNGGGLFLQMEELSEVNFTNCAFLNNTIDVSRASGGGLELIANGGIFSGENLIFENNSALGTVTAKGGGLAISLGSNSPVVDIKNLIVRDNLVEGDSVALGTGMFIGGDGQGNLTIEGAQFISNQRASGGSPFVKGQLEILASGGIYRVRNVALVDGGNGISGFRAQTFGDAVILATNLTSTNNLGFGLRINHEGSANHWIENSLIWNNFAGNQSIFNNGDGDIELQNNSLLDPGVIDFTNGNYRLQTGSLAIDACSSLTTSGIGNLDADGNSRVVNGQVDCGAYEWNAEQEDVLFQNEFETI